MITPCTCNGAGFYIKDGKRTSCSCIATNAIKRHFHSLEPYVMPSKDVIEQIKSVSEFGNAVIEVGNLSFNEIKSTVACLLVHPEHVKLRGPFVPFKLMSAYRLVDIYLGNDQEYKAIANLSGIDVLILTLGFSEMENKRLPDFLVQLMDYRGFSNKATWLVVRDRNNIPASCRAYFNKNFATVNLLKKDSKDKDI